MMISAPQVSPLAIFRSLSAGTKRSERMSGRGSGALAHEDLPAALRHQRLILLEGAVLEFDDTGIGARLAFALRHHLRLHPHAVALEERMRKLDLGHAEIG